MDAITKEEYEFYKSQDPTTLTQEELNWINEYERAEAGASSAEDTEWALYILNETNAREIAKSKKNDDWNKAIKIINQNAAANQVMRKKGQDPYVRKVKSTPEDVVKAGGFKFNWRDAYENLKEEKLRGTEADAKKLQDFINSNMYSFDDVVNGDVNLQRIAYNLHMYNPNTMKWSDFINSEDGAEFKKYLEDVRKAQTDKAVEDIWEGKDESGWEQFRSGAVNFMLPVSKEYAKNHYNDEDFSIAGPLAVDAAANFVMLGPGAAEALPAKVAAPVAKKMSSPGISWVYGNVAAPAITETGNVIFNDERLPEAFIRTLEGTAINYGTPRAIEGSLSSVGRGLPTIEGERKIQKMIDEAANKAAKVENDIRGGKPYQISHDYSSEPLEFAQLTNVRNGGKEFDKKYYSTDPKASKKYFPKYKFESINDIPDEAVTWNEMVQRRQGLPFVRGKAGKSRDATLYKFIQDEGVPTNDLLLKKAQSLAKDGDLRNLTPVELRQLGYPDKESFMNYLIRGVKMNTPSSLSTYLTNAAGRPQFGRRVGPVHLFNQLSGTNFFHKDESEEEKQKSRIERLLDIKK